MIPYEFDWYMELSQKFHAVVSSGEWGSAVQSLSCDEAFLVVTEHVQPQHPGAAATAADDDVDDDDDDDNPDGRGHDGYGSSDYNGGTAAAEMLLNGQGRRKRSSSKRRREWRKQLPTPEAHVAALRKAVLEATGLVASAGIGKNKLLARLATDAAKPNGRLKQFITTPTSILG